VLRPHRLSSVTRIASTRGLKGLEQQGLSMLHSARSRLIGQRTQVINAMRAHLSELGIIAARGLLGLAELAAIVRDERDHPLPTTARAALMVLVRQIEIISTAIAALDSELRTENKASELGPRLETIPSVGPVIASAFRAAPFSPLMRGQLELSAKPNAASSGGSPPSLVRYVGVQIAIRGPAAARQR
jgi:transposase